MSNKWKSQAPSSEMLERQTRALEESLNKLKLAMHPEKTKPTTETNVPIWDKGKAGPLSQYASHILRDEPKRVFDANKPTKIRVLGDEPPATVVRPSLVANIFGAKQAPPGTTAASNKVVRCGQCEKDEAKMKCLECAESYCATCFAHFHLRGALQRHRCVPLSESRPATPQKKKPTVGADVIFKELRFAQSKDDFLRKSVSGIDPFGYNDDDMLSESSTIGDGGGQLLNGVYDEKDSAASFQQALLQWRQGGNDKNKAKKSNRTKKSKSTHETGVDTVYDSNTKLNLIPIPPIEFHSSNLSYGEKLLLKKYRRSNKNTQEFFSQRTPQPPESITARKETNTAEKIHVNRSLPHRINLEDGNIDIEPLYDDPPTVRAEDSARTITAEENHVNNNNHFDHDDEDEELMRLKLQERTKSRMSRPNSSAMRKNSITSRPPSVALYQHPLPSLLATNPSDELKAVIDSQTVPSRPSSAALKKPPKLECRLPSMWNRNWKPEQSIGDGVDAKLIRIDQHAIDQFDAALTDLLDEDKIEIESRTTTPMEIKRPLTGSKAPNSARSEKQLPLNSSTPTPRRNSPFNFNNTPRKIDSSSSIDTGEGGFFTDVTPPKVRKSPVPPPVIPKTPTNELKQSFKSQSARSSVEQRPIIANLASLRKASIESFTRAPPKRSTTIDEAHQQIEDQSRPPSSLSSASLPVSVTSSKPDYITQPSIERHRKVTPQPPAQPVTAAKKFRVEFPKKSSPPTVAPMVIEGKKVTSARNSARNSDEYLQQSMNANKTKVSSAVQKSQNLLKTSSTSSMTSITRDDNILKDESVTITDVPLNKSMNRRLTTAEREPTRARRMEFSMKEGTKWNQASSESTSLKKSVTSSAVRRSSKVNTPRPSTPSNPSNTKVAQQFSTYDNDDGRSSRAFQDLEDEECFNQLREELTSELGMTSPGWDASLSEHVLKNLRGTEIPFNEKDLQDNLTMLETKLRETETLQRSQTDDDISVHEEIRNL